MQDGARNSPLIEKLLQPGEVGERLPDVNKLCDLIRQTSFEIHRFLRSGHLEKIYENALTHRLLKMGVDVKQQHPLDVFDEDGTLLGHFCADLFVANCLVVELKACRILVDDHVAQLLGYLRAARIEHGAFDQLRRRKAPNQEVHSKQGLLSLPFCAFCAFLWL